MHRIGSVVRFVQRATADADHAGILPGMTEELDDPHGDLERARRDPRLKHRREAVIADWRAAMESAERVRRLADSGLQILRDAELFEQQRLDMSPADPEHSERALRAARHRAALARAEADNQMVEMNAMTLVAMVSATDALVEELVPQAHRMLVEVQVRRIMDKAAKEHPKSAAQLDDEQLS